MKNNKFWIALALLILIPIAFILVLREGEIVSSKLPIYGERTVIGPGDTVYHKVHDFSFIDQEGDTVTQAAFDGKIYVANFFFTTCPDICPNMMQNMQFVYNKYKDSPDIKFLSHTVDPKRDSVAKLKEYGYNLGAMPKQWYMVTGSKSALYRAAEKSYLVAAVTTDISTAFIHSDKLVLVDDLGRIRGFYEGLDFRDMRRLSDDIKALIVERHEREATRK